MHFITLIIFTIHTVIVDTTTASVLVIKSSSLIADHGLNGRDSPLQFMVNGVRRLRYNSIDHLHNATKQSHELAIDHL